MSLPASNEIPIELRISSSINMILLEFKLLDRIEDSRGIISEFAYRAFLANFAKAAELLSELNFPIADAFAWLKVQSVREKTSTTPNDLPALPEPGLQQLLYYAEATKVVTSSLFKQAAIACKQSEHTDTFTQLGASFGNLIYILDALEDRQDDLASHAFNGITSAYNLDTHLSEEAKAESVNNIFSHTEQICSCLHRLPLPNELQQQFQQRFRGNVKQRLAKLALIQSNETKKHKRLNSCSTQKKAPSTITIINSQLELKTPASFAARIRQDYSSRRFQLNTIAERFVFAYAYVFAMILGTVAHEAETFSDCLELPFNLIFLSAVAKQVVKEFFVRNQLITAHAAAPANMVGGGSFASIGLDDEEFRKKPKDPSENSNADLCDCCDLGCSCCNGSGGTCCDCSACDCSACDCSACHHSGSCCDCAGGGCDCSGCGSGGCDCGSCDCGGCNCQ